MRIISVAALNKFKFKYKPSSDQHQKEKKNEKTDKTQHKKQEPQSPANSSIKLNKRCTFYSIKPNQDLPNKSKLPSRFDPQISVRTTR